VEIVHEDFDISVQHLEMGLIALMGTALDGGGFSVRRLLPLFSFTGQQLIVA
jgi:hypothetical protein